MRTRQTRPNTSMTSRLTAKDAASKWADLADYWLAPGGIGPHAANWADKPHRLIYNLIVLVAEARELLTAREQKNFKRRLQDRELALDKKIK